jgi:hypothetical protein
MPKRLPSRPWVIAHHINVSSFFEVEDEDDDEYENDFRSDAPPRF